MNAVNALTILLALGAGAPAEQKPTVVLVVGAGGTSGYAEEFHTWADRWEKAALQGGKQVVRIGNQSSSSKEDITGREKLRQTLQQQQEETLHPLWLVLIGHGTFNGRTAKFNLQGPDVSAQELAQWLEGQQRPLAVVNCASASGPFLQQLSQPNRVVITATKSGHEHNYARFGKFLSQAINDPRADLDKDNQTSLLEAFLIASKRTSEFYESESRLPTEHALLDDNGDKMGTRADWFQGIRPVKKPSGNASVDGNRAHQFHLVPSPQEKQMPPELRQKRDELELSVAELRRSKKEMSEDEYYAQLEELMLQLARLYEQADALTNEKKTESSSSEK